MAELRADVAVIGAGVAGLIVAAYAARAGRSVIVLERRRIPGGRFSGEVIAGAQVSTGALHMIPHGSRGPLAACLAELGIEQPIVNSEVLCSVWSPSGHIVIRRWVDALRFALGGGQPWTALRAGLELRFGSGFEGSLADWLQARRVRGRMRDLIMAFTDFAISLRPEQLAYPDFRRIVASFWRLGGPGVPSGGSRAMSESLRAHVEARGGRVLLGHEVVRIKHLGGSAAGWAVAARDRAGGQELTIVAADLVATAGEDLPGLRDGGRPAAAEHPGPACGFKIQALLPFPIVPHNGVMFCTGTRRISGIAQLSNADPSLAPAGLHLVNTFHSCPTNADPKVERREAMADLEQIAGREIRQEWILATAIFRSSWPVNRRPQGREVAPRGPDGIYFAGDGCKPAGLIMAEGAAASAREVARELRLID